MVRPEPNDADSSLMDLPKEDLIAAVHALQTTNTLLREVANLHKQRHEQASERNDELMSQLRESIDHTKQTQATNIELTRAYLNISRRLEVERNIADQHLENLSSHKIKAKRVLCNLRTLSKYMEIDVDETLEEAPFEAIKINKEILNNASKTFYKNIDRNIREFNELNEVLGTQIQKIDIRMHAMAEEKAKFENLKRQHENSLSVSENLQQKFDDLCLGGV